MSTEEPQSTPKFDKDILLSFPRPVDTYHRETYARIDPAASSFTGEGKTLLITGGAQGIGLEISRSFAAARVSRICIVSRRPGPLGEAKKTLQQEYPNVQVDTYSASVSNYSDIANIVGRVGPVDILVLSAAYAHAHDPVDRVPLEGMEASYTTNVIGNWHLVNAVLAARGDKRCIVINVSSFSAYRTLPRQSAYGPSKAAFTQIMSEFAKEYAESDVRFVTYHPGSMWTELTSKNFQKEWFEGWEDVKMPGDFAVWLASPEADFLHGRFVWAAWDVDELVGLRSKVESDPSFLKIGLVQ